MLNEKGIRELAYTVLIDSIEPIEGSDNCEAAVVGGWRIMVRKGTFKMGDIAIYFEIDSKVPQLPEFEFLAKKHYTIKTQKYTFGGKGNFISQGLLMSLSDFPQYFEYNQYGWLYTSRVKSTKNPTEAIIDIHDGLTELLGVTYSVAEDNKRKAGTDKYSKMKARHQKLFKTNKIVQWLWKRDWGKKVLFFFLGTKKDKRGWPDWVVKTDEERCQNLPHLFPGDETKWIVTEKIDGSSTTFTMKGHGKKQEFYVCSRNVCFDTPEKAEHCYYDSNIYLEMSEKYHIKDVLTMIMDANRDLEFVTLQGETYGDGIQKRTYGLKNGEHDFMAFNLIYKYKNEKTSVRLNPIELNNSLSLYGIPCVPVIEKEYKLPETCEELLQYAEGNSVIDGEMREGIVLRGQDGVASFKAVSNEFLLRYHS